MPRPIVAGLDLGTSAIRMVVCTPAKDSKVPRVLAQVKKESRGLKRGYIVNFEESLRLLRETVRETERQAKTKLKSAVLGIGGVTLETKTGEGQVMVSRADQEVTENDINRALEVSEANLGEMANRRIIHTVPIAFKLDGKKILGRPEGMKGAKLEIKTLFVHCFNQHLNDLVKLINQAGLAVDDIVAAPLAGSFATISLTQKMAGCVLVNIGSQTTSLVVFEEGLPMSLQVLPIGSNDVTHDIALGLRISLDEAERLKRESGNAISGKKKLDEIIEARLSDMFDMIDAHLKKIGRSGLLPAGLVIIGGGAHVDNLEKLARENLRLPAKIFDPLTSPLLKTQIKDSGWVVAYGLCLLGLGLETEDSFGVKIIRHTKNKFLRWLRELLP